MSTTTSTADEGKEEEKWTIRVNVPQRLITVPLVGVIVGLGIGMTRGGRAAGLRFLAENVHRPPKTVQGWYFYNKTKNYKVILGALKSGGWEALKLGMVGAGWVGMEEGMEKMGWGEVKEIGAGIGTAGMYSAVYRLPRKVVQRTVVLGLVMGSCLTGLRWGRRELEGRRAVLEEGTEGDRG